MRPKVYENDHKKVLGTYLVLFVIEGQIWQNFDLQSQFPMSKISQIFAIFFIEEYKTGR